MTRRSTHVTPFQKKVYDSTRTIPRGKVSTYKLIAKAIGCNSSRAVGQALRRNPFAPVVPCHRVIRGNLTIGGFGGKTSGRNIRRKKTMLKAEGVHFVAGRLADPDRVYTFTR